MFQSQLHLFNTLQRRILNYANDFVATEIALIMLEVTQTHT